MQLSSLAPSEQRCVSVLLFVLGLQLLVALTFFPIVGEKGKFQISAWVFFL